MTPSATQNRTPGIGGNITRRSRHALSACRGFPFRHRILPNPALLRGMLPFPEPAAPNPSHTRGESSMTQSWTPRTADGKPKA